MNNRLTLDYGLRFTHQQPQHDALLQASNFFPDQWSRANAPLLYVPGCTSRPARARPPAASRSTRRPAPRSGRTARSRSARWCRTPATVTNGVIQAGQGIAKENYTWPAHRRRAAHRRRLRRQRHAEAWSSAATSACSTTGPRATRPSNQIGNPPNSTATTRALRAAADARLGRPDDAGAGAAGRSTIRLEAADDAAVEHRRADDAAMVLVARRVVRRARTATTWCNPFNQAIDINSVDLGTAFLPQNQDPTHGVSATPGAAALTTDLLRPFRGYGAINMQWGRFWNDFHSIQTSFNRRFSRRPRLRAQLHADAATERDQRPERGRFTPPGAQR